MVMEPTVLVVDDKQQGVIPQWTVTNGVVDLADKGFATVNGEIGMLAVGLHPVVDRLDERVLGNVVVLAVLGEVPDVEELVLIEHEVAVGQQDARLAGIDTVGCVEVDGIFVDIFEDCMGREGGFYRVLGERAAG